MDIADTNDEDNNGVPYFDLKDAIYYILSGMQSIGNDKFTECFTAHKVKPWTQSWYNKIIWFVALIVRYCILFPIRAIIWHSYLLFVALCLPLTVIFPQSIRVRIQRFLFIGLSHVTAVATSAVIRVHGNMPARKANQIYVANHSSIIDYVMLMNVTPFACVGAYQPGIIGFIENNLAKSVNCLFLDRSSAKDRGAITSNLKDHIQHPEYCPMLIFPEGTCVNNKYCIMFKKGAFCLDAEVCPIVLKYDLDFCDAYWNSKQYGFYTYLLGLFASWALVLDITFLDPQTQKEGETSTAFACRVRDQIAEVGGFQVRDFDGYFKHQRPGQHYVEQQRAQFYNKLYGIEDSSSQQD